MKNFKVTLQLIAGYYEDGDPRIHLEHHIINAESEEDAIDLVKELSTSPLSLFDAYADEMDD